MRIKAQGYRVSHVNTATYVTKDTPLHGLLNQRAGDMAFKNAFYGVRIRPVVTKGKVSIVH